MVIILVLLQKLSYLKAAMEQLLYFLNTKDGKMPCKNRAPSPKGLQCFEKRPRFIHLLRGPNFSQFWPPNTLEWTIGALYLLKVRYFRNVFLVSSISSKKRTKTSRIVVKSNSFVRFLKEFVAWQFAFEINWPLACMCHIMYIWE